VIFRRPFRFIPRVLKVSLSNKNFISYQKFFLKKKKVKRELVDALLFVLVEEFLE
jgi:hypothetical protein